MRKYFVWIVLAISFAVGLVAADETEYSYIASAITGYQQSGFSDTNALQIIYDVARSEVHQVIVAHSMTIYTLHQGKANNARLCYGGYRSIMTRYPDSFVATFLRTLHLFPDPCPDCMGNAQKLPLGNTRCPTCNGVVKGVNVGVAHKALNVVCENALKELKLADECKSTFLEITQIKDVKEQLAMVGKAVNQFEKAFNLDLLTSLQEEIELRMQAIRQEEARVLQELEAKHRELLNKLRALSTPVIAMQEAKNFLAQNPNSPVSKDFDLFIKEIEHRILERQQKEVRKRTIIRSAIFGGLLLVVIWLVTSFRVTWVRYAFVGQAKKSTRLPMPTPVDDVSEHSELNQAAAVTLYPKPPLNNQFDVVECPACQSLLGCPKNLQNGTVKCSNCKHLFVVQ